MPEWFEPLGWSLVALLGLGFVTSPLWGHLLECEHDPDEEAEYHYDRTFYNPHLPANE